MVRPEVNPIHQNIKSIGSKSQARDSFRQKIPQSYFISKLEDKVRCLKSL
jgi:hypothetical protein